MPLNARNADDKRVVNARIQLIAARKVFEKAELDRDNLVRIMHGEGSSVEYLAQQFAMKEQRIKWIVENPKED